MPLRPLIAVERDIQSWITLSNRDCRQRFVQSDCIWVLKYISPRFLPSFIRDKKLKISATDGDDNASLSYAIGGVPSGAVLSSAADPVGVSYNPTTQIWTVAAGALRAISR